MTLEGFLKLYLAQRKEELASQHQKLILEDAPKNKMTIITGRLLEAVDLESEIERFLNKARDS
jgi:hypothetical protein